ncbi:MAG: hypothetical protein HY429_04425 [Candidatus Levybacteria bacterium]|nr:hypothetical protein [Candidatus Levybacteria bacterium]
MEKRESRGTVEQLMLVCRLTAPPAGGIPQPLLFASSPPRRALSVRRPAAPPADAVLDSIELLLEFDQCKHYKEKATYDKTRQSCTKEDMLAWNLTYAKEYE